MNKKNIIGALLVVVTAGMVGLILSTAGEAAARAVGKAAWYLPYVSLVGAVRCFRAA